MAFHGIDGQNFTPTFGWEVVQNISQNFGHFHGVHSCFLSSLCCPHTKLFACLCLFTLFYLRSGLPVVSSTHTHIRLMAFCPGLPGWAGTRKVKSIWIPLKQEIVSGSGISWAICKSAPWQITMPAPHHSVFYRPDALPAAQPTASKHWRHQLCLAHGTKLGAISQQGGGR